MHIRRDRGVHGYQLCPLARRSVLHIMKSCGHALSLAVRAVCPTSDSPRPDAPYVPPHAPSRRSPLPDAAAFMPNSARREVPQSSSCCRFRPCRVRSPTFPAVHYSTDSGLKDLRKSGLLLPSTPASRQEFVLRRRGRMLPKYFRRKRFLCDSS